MHEQDYSYCRVAERTDVGCKRQANEDNMTHFVCQNGLVAAVCDGMGGHVGGAVASQTAVDAIRQYLTDNYFDDPRTAIGMAIDVANHAILDKARQQPELTGMGSTCVMLIVRDGRVYIGSVGDSRVYIVRERKIRQLTKDQSYVQILVDIGQITREQAEHHPRKNEITNCLGLETMQPATVLQDAFEPQAGDCFLLCSDGLSGMVNDVHIERIVSRQSEMSSQQRVDKLVETAKLNGGVDNITVQIVEFSVTPGETHKMPDKKHLIMYAAVIVGAICLIIAAVLFFRSRNSNQLEQDDKNKDSIKTVVEDRNDTIILFNKELTVKDETKGILRITFFQSKTKLELCKDSKEGEVVFDTIMDKQIHIANTQPACEEVTIKDKGGIQEIPLKLKEEREYKFFFKSSTDNRDTGLNGRDTVYLAIVNLKRQTGQQKKNESKVRKVDVESSVQTPSASDVSKTVADNVQSQDPKLPNPQTGGSPAVPTTQNTDSTIIQSPSTQDEQQQKAKQEEESKTDSPATEFPFVQDEQQQITETHINQENQSKQGKKEKDKKDKKKDK